MPRVSRITRAALWLPLLLACSSARVVEPIVPLRTTELETRPSRILVFDFAVTPDQLTLDEGAGPRLLRSFQQTDVSAEQEALGQQVADLLAEEIVQGLLELGLPGERADRDTRLGGALLLVLGQFVTLDEGNRTRRLAIGFGAGASEVRTEVQLYGVQGGFRDLARAFATESTGSKLPGATTPLGVGAAAGSLARGVAVAAGKSVASEALGESLTAGAKRTARRIVRELALLHADQGWLAQDRVPSDSNLPKLLDSGLR